MATKTKKAYEQYLNELYGDSIKDYTEAQKEFGHMAKTKKVKLWGGIHPLIIKYYNAGNLGTFMRKYGSIEFNAGFNDWNPG